MPLSWCLCHGSAWLGFFIIKPATNPLACTGMFPVTGSLRLDRLCAMCALQQRRAPRCAIFADDPKVELRRGGPCFAKGSSAKANSEPAHGYVTRSCSSSTKSISIACAGHPHYVLLLTNFWCAHLAPLPTLQDSTAGIRSFHDALCLFICAGKMLSFRVPYSSPTHTISTFTPHFLQLPLQYHCVRCHGTSSSCISQ